MTDCVLEGQNAESATLIANLREVIQAQATEIESLKSKLDAASSQTSEVRHRARFKNSQSPS